MIDLYFHRYDIDADHHYSEILNHAHKLKDLSGPVYNLDETQHHFQEMTKHVESLIPLAKPIFVDERHNYGEQSQKEQGVKEVHGPIYVKENVKHNYSEKAKGAELQTISLKGPIYMTDDYKHHFSAIQGHVDTLKNLQGPVYQTEGKNHYLGIIKHVEKLQELKGPIYEFGTVEHKFVGGHILLPDATEMKTLHGPKYEIDAEHHFSEIVSNAQKIKDLHGPIYNIDENEHHFREMTRHLESLMPMAKPIFVDERHSYGEQIQKEQGVKEVHGPIYVKENTKHNYSEQPKPDHLQTISLKGPIYMKDDYKHHFSAIQDHVETLKTLKGPIYQTEGKNHFLEIMKHAEKIKDLKGPIYEFGKTEHNFVGGQIMLPAATELKSLHGPRYIQFSKSEKLNLEKVNPLCLW